MVKLQKQLGPQRCQLADTHSTNKQRGLVEERKKGKLFFHPWLGIMKSGFPFHSNSDVKQLIQG